MDARRVDNPRRWMAFRSSGTYELLMEIQGALEDFLGAVRTGQHGVAALAARAIVLRCLSVRALAAAGDPPDLDNPLADPFAGLRADVVGAGVRLARDVARADGADLAEQVEPVTGYVRAFERELGFDEPPPSVRRPEGLYPALRLARELLPLNQASGLPLALPSAWLPAQPTATTEVHA